MAMNRNDFYSFAFICRIFGCGRTKHVVSITDIIFFNFSFDSTTLSLSLLVEKKLVHTIYFKFYSQSTNTATDIY